MTTRVFRSLRAAWRFTALVSVIAYFASVFLLHRRNRRSLAARARWLQRTCRATLRALNVRGSPIGPEPHGSMIASNHLGYLDILVLAAATPVVFVAKREVASWPIFGWFARMAGTRFIDRETRSDVARVAGDLAPAIDAELGLVLFLEGTSTDGTSVLPFKSSLLETAVRAGWPVVPAALTYGLPAGYSVRDEVCWWGDMTLMPHLLHLLTLPRIEAFVAWGSAVVGVNNRKTLAASLHARVVALHDALVGCVSPEAGLAATRLEMANVES